MQISKGAYGGPIVHWWICSFAYCGFGANWTYEGLIEAYLELHRKTNNEFWLKRAIHSGDCLAGAQMPDGTYKNSFFENNPLYGSSSVHEASVDLGLLSLAAHLEGIGLEGGKYFDVALRNAEMSLYQRLWDPTLKTFRSADDRFIRGSYVPNIMATVAQVFLKLYSQKRTPKYLELVLSTMDYVLRCQRKNPNSILFGSFPQLLKESNAFALYNARIAVFLTNVYEALREDRALEAAELCGIFLRKLQQKEGGFALFADERGKVCNRPRLIGGVAETLRALLQLKKVSSYHSDFNETPHVEWLLRFQDSIGGFRTGEGFHYDIEKSDYKDIFHVCGWNDKVFRLLASLFSGHSMKDRMIHSMEQSCWVGNVEAFFVEDEKEIMIQDKKGRTIYRWVKGDNLAFVDKDHFKYFVRVSPAQSGYNYSLRSMASVFVH